MVAFQSLKGFQRLWSQKETTEILKKVAVSIPKRVSEALKQPKRQHTTKEFESFQSLKGFQRLWSAPFTSKMAAPVPFQSLKGFQRLWSPKFLFRITQKHFVSIPKRVSEALKLSNSAFPPKQSCVSIPKRVSEALKQQEINLNPFPTSWKVSIPKRVSEALKRNRCCCCFCCSIWCFNP